MFVPRVILFKQLSIKLVKRMTFLPLILSAILLCKATEAYSFTAYHAPAIWSTLTKRFLVEFYFLFFFFLFIYFLFVFIFSLLLCVFCSVSIIAAHRGGHGFVTAICIHLLTKCVLTLIRPASVRRFY